MASFANQSQWSQRDILNLLQSMESNIPADDLRTFQHTLADLDWDKVAFQPFSGEMCKIKWREISHPLRKRRTLTELVLEAKEVIQDPGQRKKGKPHPDFPKRPLTAYMRFYKEQRAKYSRMYPEYTNQQLTQVMARDYSQLPVEVRERYIQDFQKDKEDFQEKLTQFKKQHAGGRHPQKSVLPTSQEINVSTKSQRVMQTGKSAAEKGLPKPFSSPPAVFQGEPKKPPMNGYEKFHRDSWSSPELHHLSFRERWVEIGRRWHRVPWDQKEHYTRQAEELQKQYLEKLNRWLKKLSPQEYVAYTEAKASCGKRKNRAMPRGRSPKCARADTQSSSETGLQGRPAKAQGLLDSGPDSSETTKGPEAGSQPSMQIRSEDGKEEDTSSSSDSSSSDEDDEWLPLGNTHL